MHFLLGNSIRNAIMLVTPWLSWRLSMEKWLEGIRHWHGTRPRSTGLPTSRWHHSFSQLIWGKSLPWIWHNLQSHATPKRDRSSVVVIFASLTTPMWRNQMQSSRSATTISSMQGTQSRAKPLQGMSKEDSRSKIGKCSRSNLQNDQSSIISLTIIMELIFKLIYDLVVISKSDGPRIKDLAPPYHLRQWYGGGQSWDECQE